MKDIIIGTRGSQLALWQAEFIKKKLSKVTDRPVRLEVIKTAGDKIDNLSFDKMEGKGFFTKEIEDSLLNGGIDLAVHSLKDLMTTLPKGLVLPAVGFREDSREALLVRKDSYTPGRTIPVKENGVVGSGSVRRQSQMAHLAPDLLLEDLRGNVPTRIRKLREGQYDAIILAYAGILRLEIDLSEFEVVILEKEKFLPAPGQGILAIQSRENDAEINEIASRLDDPSTRLQMNLERGLLARFEGGCQLPLGVYSEINGVDLGITAVLGIRENGRWINLKRKSSSGTDPEKLIRETFAFLVG